MTYVHTPTYLLAAAAAAAASTSAAAAAEEDPRRMHAGAAAVEEEDGADALQRPKPLQSVPHGLAGQRGDACAGADAGHRDLCVPVGVFMCGQLVCVRLRRST